MLQMRNDTMINAAGGKHFGFGKGASSEAKQIEPRIRTVSHKLSQNTYLISKLNRESGQCSLPKDIKRPNIAA